MIRVVDPAIAAVAACRAASKAYDAACNADTEGDSETTEVIAASKAFRDSWKAVCRTSPTTLDGVRIIARCAIEFAEDMGSDDYLEDALVALAMIDGRPDGGVQ